MKKRIYNESIVDLENKIGYVFKNKEILLTALTHSSYAYENGVKSNERLEFLGDSVISFLTTYYLFERFGEKDEGSLTKIKRQLVNTDALSKMAQKINLGQVLFLGVGEEKCNGRTKLTNLEDAFEALTGAIYLDGGINSAKKFLIKFIDKETTKIDGIHKLSDPKTLLQEKVQETPGEKLEYVIIDEQGPDHDKLYTSAVKINSNVFGVGVGKSKKEAEKAAAAKALEMLGVVTERD